MKKIIAVLALAMCFSVAYAQEHLLFKGIPINGTSAQFGKALTAKGFVYNEYLGGYIGTFAGQEMVVAPLVLDNEDLVHSVAAIRDFEAGSSWTTILTAYNNMKSMLIQKYGQPTECEEYCKDQYDVTLYEKKHKSFFVTDYGFIGISISKSSIGYGHIAFGIVYIDKVNSQKQISSAIDDL